MSPKSSLDILGQTFNIRKSSWRALLPADLSAVFLLFSLFLGIFRHNATDEDGEMSSKIMAKIFFEIS